MRAAASEQRHPTSASSSVSSSASASPPPAPTSSTMASTLRRFLPAGRGPAKGAPPKQQEHKKQHGGRGSDAGTHPSRHLSDDDLHRWPDDTPAGQEQKVDYRFLSRHLLASAVEGTHVGEANIRQSFEDLKLLVADERLLLAHALWEKVEAHLTAHTDATLGPNARAVRNACTRPAARARLRDLERRVGVCHAAFRDLANHDGWIFAQRFFGVTTHYRLHGDGTIDVRLQGELRGCSVFDQLAVLREADLFHRWMPFVRDSRIVAEVGKTELVFCATIHVPWIATRDAVVHIFACDHTEKGILLVCGESVPEDDDEAKDEAAAGGRGDRGEEEDGGGDGRLPSRLAAAGFEMPPKPSGWNADRMRVKDFRAQLQITSPRTCYLDVIANIDPKVPLPQPIINFGTRRLAGMILYYLQKHAHKVAQDPHGNPHALRMRDSPFYENYFIPRVLSLCQARGWDLGPVPVFDAPGLPDCPVTRRWQEEKARYSAHLAAAGAAPLRSPLGLKSPQQQQLQQQLQQPSSLRSLGSRVLSPLASIVGASTPRPAAAEAAQAGDVGLPSGAGAAAEREGEEADREEQEEIERQIEMEMELAAMSTWRPLLQAALLRGFLVLSLAGGTASIHHSLAPLPCPGPSPQQEDGAGGGRDHGAHLWAVAGHMLLTAVLRQAAVALASRSPSVRWLAWRLSALLMLVALAAATWVVYRPVLLLDPEAQGLGFLLLSRHDNEEEQQLKAASAISACRRLRGWVRVGEVVVLPMLLWFYWEARRWCYRLRRRREIALEAAGARMMESGLGGHGDVGVDRAGKSHQD